MTTSIVTDSVNSMNAAIAGMHRKALTFFRNYIINTTGRIEKHEVFKLLISHADGDILRNILKMDQEIISMDTPNSVEKKLQFDWNMCCSHEPVRTQILSAVDKITESMICTETLFTKRVEDLRDVLGFNELELDFVQLGFFTNEGILEIVDEGRRARTNALEQICQIAACLNVEPEKLHKALEERGRLRRSGCVSREFLYTGKLNFYLLGMNDKPLHANFFYPDGEEDILPWNYFDTLTGKHGSLLKQMIETRGSEQPVNILFYGEPGTGKTSFARALARETNKKCYMIAQSTQDDSYTPKSDASIGSRFAALEICCDQIDHDNSLVIVDEADDMLSQNKGQLNDALDSVPFPVIWITNTAADTLNPSSRRRFDYSIRFEKLSAEQRFKIWQHSVSRYHLQKMFDDSMIRSLAKHYAISAGGISLMLKNMAQLNPAKNNVEPVMHQLMKQHYELMCGEQKVRQNEPAKDYTLKGLNIRSGIGLDRIVTAVKHFRQSAGSGMDQPRMNLLLSGVPGAGKTEFVKYLGQTLDAEVIIKMGSDLLDKYVGETEKRIRNAFEEARDRHAILFLDEIDGMLQNRENAEHNWEISPVNELLYCMENFKGIFIGATNFNRHLDPAVIRRFTFKLEFGYLDNAGKTHFFEHMFQTKLTDPERLRLDGIPCLTPGDFRTVRQGIFYLGESATNNDRLQMLEVESRAKREKESCTENRVKIGFQHALCKGMAGSPDFPSF